MNPRRILKTVGAATVALVCGPALAAQAPLPNIVVVLADDMGFGDVRCYDPQFSKIPTPNADRLAGQGMCFTNAHAPSAVCTPSRYGLLTGRYAWRTRLQEGVLRPYDPPLIDANRLTVPALLKRQGYHTACIGKWHLGWDWPRTGGTLAIGDRTYPAIDFTQSIANGPTTRGFETYFGTDVPNYPPFAFIANDRLTARPTELFSGDRSMVMNDPGPMAPGWRFDRILPTLTENAVNYVGERARSKTPFFLYLALTTPHEPLAPSEKFKGKSGISPVGDLIMETDWALGQIMQALEQNGVADQTLVVFVTDNGHCHYTGLEPFINAGHRISGPYRGHKSDTWEGGSRVPFIARWPGITPAGSRCAQMICLTDLLATCAAITGQTLPDSAGEDSISLLPLLKGEIDKPVRESVITHSSTGRFSIQQGPWKLILGPDSGGWADDAKAVAEGLPQIQLYNLDAEPGEMKNLQGENREKVAELTALLEKMVRDGRSTSGAIQKNDTEPAIFKPIQLERLKKERPELLKRSAP